MSDILPESGLIKITDLAIWSEVGIESLMASLTKAKIPVLKIGKNHRTWLVRLEDLRVSKQ